MILYVLVGGMKGTTWVQIIKAVLLIAGAGRDDASGCWRSSASTSPTLLQGADRHGRRGRRGAPRARAAVRRLGD